MENKTYAVIKNGIVIDLILFDSKALDSDLEFFKQELNADKIIYCDPSMDVPYINGDIIGGRFRPPTPVEGFIWNNASWMWVPPVEKIPDTLTETFIFDTPQWKWIPVLRQDVQ
jgi:hypothetical protein